MFKKAFQVAMTFGVLVAAYAGYVHVFALVASGVGSTAAKMPVFLKTQSKNEQHASELVVRALGKGHWAAADGLPIRIINADKGFWIYAREKTISEDGKVITLTPFVAIIESRDGKSLKVVTSDRAVLNLDQPINQAMKPGSGGNLRVVHARLEDNVLLRDDKGTVDPRDDLRVERLTYVEYDEAALQLNSESEVLIRDNTYRITGLGMLIKLRPKEENLPPGTPTGFNGAQTAFLKKDVHIVLSDVGPSGILPGNSQPGAKVVEKTPVDLRCDGMMRIDLPKPVVPVLVGPPTPPPPTIAEFFRNVEVKRGKPGAAPDQLNCDQLTLTLVRPLKDAKAAPGGLPAEAVALNKDDPSGDSEAPTEGDAMTDLTLRRAHATGQNVWLVSAAQGIKARCNELTHEKNLPESPDTTYLRGDTTTRLVVEKTDVVTEGPDKGKVTAFTTIRTIDATIFDDGHGNENAMIVARGPGELESRPDKDKPVERIARWIDMLKIQPEYDPNAKPLLAGEKAAPATKRITLTNQTVGKRVSFIDLPGDTNLNARDVLVVWLKPKPKAADDKVDLAVAKAAATKTEGGPAVGGASFDIEKLVALGDVHLTSPGKNLVARDRLDAVFTSRPDLMLPTPAPVPTAPAKPAASSPAPTTPPPAAAPAPERPVEPDARASANRVWASLLLLPPSVSGSTPPASPAGPGMLGGGSGTGRRAELDKVMLRGDVVYHQDPAPDKARGTDVVGQALDVTNIREKGTDRTLGTRLLVYHLDQTAEARKPKDKRLDDDAAPLALVRNDEMTIRGKRIGLDQTTDQAWVDGRGSMTQIAATSLLSDKGLASQAKPDGAKAGRGGVPDAAPEVKKGPMTIYFANNMKFFGQSTDMQGRPAARAEFYRDVHAENDESTLDCRDVMRVFFDKTVKLARLKPEPTPKTDPDAPPESKPEIATIECVSKVVVVNRKADPLTKAILQKQRIDCEYLVYEKTTGNFHVPTPGVVYLYDRDKGDGNGLKVSGNGDFKPTSDVRVIRTAGPGPDAGQPRAPAVRPASGRAGTAPVVGRNGTRDPVKDKPAMPVLPPLVLTQITFAREMHGRFGSGNDPGKPGPRQADFFGDVQTYRAQVASADSLLDPDDMPADGMLMTAQVLRVISEPIAPKGDEPAPPPRNLLRAWENAYVALTEGRTIQADTITYNSETNLFYAYGEEGRDVILAQQDQLGQPASTTRGTATMYNIKTGESQLMSPKEVAAVDYHTGYRPVPTKPDDKPTKIKRTPRVRFRSMRGNIERKDFNGR